jgi:hypothetical protein
MDRRDLEEIERFLSSVGRASLFVYYAVDPAAPLDVLEDAVKKRRTWAQGQQSNPKYKYEALFIIKSNALLRRVLLDNLDEYRDHVRDDTAGRNLDVLSLFIKGTLSSGTLSSQAEAAVLYQGRQLELSDVAVVRRLEELLLETGTVREPSEPDDVTAEGTAIDHYAVLGVATNAQTTAIEEAYRSRYRWARSLKDLKRSAEVLQALDDAWRMLSDPKRRMRYDERRLEMLEVTDEVEKRSAALIGLLGGPEDAITGEEPMPGGTPAVAVHEVGFRAAATAPPGTRAPKIEARGAAAPPRPTVDLRAATPARPSVEPTPSAPVGAPLPPSVSGRTIGLATGPQTVATSGPRLSVDGSEVLSLKVGGRPIDRVLVVRNIGQGKMPGRVTSDREWLKIKVPRLDPLAATQQVEVTVLSKQMPWGRTAGTITVVTDHGERRTLTVQVNRPSPMPLIAGVAALGLLGGAVLGGALWLSRPTPTSVLALTVDPIADRVIVDGQIVGSGSQLDIAAPSPGKPFRLRVETDGFAPKEELVTLGAEEKTTRTLRLDLADEMRWTPAADATSVKASQAMSDALQASVAALSPCFAGPGTTTADAVYTAWITSDGQVRRVEITESSFPVEPAQGCIERAFRGLRLPSFTGDYSAVEARLSVPVKP